MYQSNLRIVQKPGLTDDSNFFIDCRKSGEGLIGSLGIMIDSRLGKIQETQIENKYYVVRNYNNLNNC